MTDPTRKVFWNEVIGFQEVDATANPGSTDSAWLYDGGGTNTFVGQGSTSTVTNTAYLTGTGYKHKAIGFPIVYAFASAGSKDTATLNDAGTGTSNIFGGLGGPGGYAYLTDSMVAAQRHYWQEPIGFLEVDAKASLQQHGHGLAVRRPRLGHAPIEHDGLAEGTEHHVGRLQIAVEDPTAMGVSDCLADLAEDLQHAKALHFSGHLGIRVRRVKFVDGLLEGPAMHEGHDVKRLAILVGPQVVDGHNPRMLQLAGDLGFRQETVLRFAALLAEPLQGDLTTDLGVFGQPDFADRKARPGTGIGQEETVAAVRGVTDVESPIVVVGDVDIALRPDRHVGPVGGARAGGVADARMFNAGKHRVQEAAPRFRLELRLPALAAVARDGDFDSAAPCGRGFAGEPTHQVVVRPDRIEVAIIGVGLAVGQCAEGIDGQVRNDVEGDRVMAVIGMGSDCRGRVPRQAAVVAPGHKHAVVRLEAQGAFTDAEFRG